MAITRKENDMLYSTYNDVLSKRPDDVKDGDAFALKIVAVAGYNNDVAYYVGDTSMPDEEVVSNGDKLMDAGQDAFSYLMQLRYYRR